MSRGGGGAGGAGGISNGTINGAFAFTMINGAVTSWMTAITQTHQMKIDLRLKESQWSADAVSIVKPPPISGGG